MNKVSHASLSVSKNCVSLSQSVFCCWQMHKENSILFLLFLSLFSFPSQAYTQSNTCLNALWNGRYSLAPITTDLDSSPSVSPYVYSHRTWASIKRGSLQKWFVNLTCKRRLTCCPTCWATMYSTDATLYDCVLTHWHTPLGIVPDCLYRTICLCLIQSVTHNRYSRSTHNFVTLLFL